MDYCDVLEKDGCIVLSDVSSFDCAQTLDCGQCFRWTQIEPDTWEGIAHGRLLRITQKNSSLTLHQMNGEEFRRTWAPYLDLDRDYGAVQDLLRADPVMERAVRFAPGIRVLRQEAWETVCSFIISANNHIPRIRGIIERLCELCGEPIGRNRFAFPTPARLAGLSVADLAPLRAGYRARYLVETARMVADGTVDLRAADALDNDDLQRTLCRLPGVGPKVANCVILYGYGRADCVPVDVWIRRAFRELYPEGFPQAFGRYAGIAQQYLFHYMRNRPVEEEPRSVGIT